MRTPLVASLVALTVLLAGCAEDTPPPGDDGDGTPPVGDAGRLDAMAPGNYTVVLRTTLGNFTVELYEDKAPVSVANFLQYAEDGHYEGTVFHRVVKGFVVQGGGFPSPFTGQGGPKATHGPIPTESWEGAHHGVGTLGMARTNDPNSGSSQWFVNTADNSNLDAGYTVFGRVVEGMETIYRIEATPTTTKGGFQNVPAEDVVVTGVEVHAPGLAPKPSVALFRSDYDVVAGRSVSLPVVVKNIGGGHLDATFSVEAPEGVTASWTREPDALSPGQAGVAILQLAAAEGFSSGAVTVAASGGEARDTVVVGLRAVSPEAAEAGPDHGKVQTRYLGLYDNAVVFDTTYTDLADRGFVLPAGFQEHPEPLKVWVGEGDSPTRDYTPVIEGFAKGVVGLREGETRTARLTPEEGYRDGHFRTFEMTVASLD